MADESQRNGENAALYASLNLISKAIMEKLVILVSCSMGEDLGHRSDRKTEHPVDSWHPGHELILQTCGPVGGMIELNE